MKTEVKFKKCADKDCKNEFKPYLSTQKYCSYGCTRCTHKNKKSPANRLKKPIPSVSDKMKKLLYQYGRVRKQFLLLRENQSCPVTGQKATQIHHMRGRGKESFADDLARKTNTPLLIDTRFFLAVSMEGHRKIEENPIWAKEMGYSLDRLSKIN